MMTKPWTFILMGFALAGAFPGRATAQHLVLSPADSGAGSAGVCSQGCQRQACDQGTSVRVVGGRVVSTTNGVDWVERSVPTPSRLRCVASGRGLFVAVGDEGAIVTSRDCVHWTLRDSATDERLRGIVYAQGLFVAVGYHGTIITSKDGLTWKRRNSSVPDRLQGVAYGNGAFVAVGWNGCVLASRDGKRWVPQSRLEGRLQSVVFHNGVFVTSNPEGADWLSGNGITWGASQCATNTASIDGEKIKTARTPLLCR